MSGGENWNWVARLGGRPAQDMFRCHEEARSVGTGTAFYFSSHAGAFVFSMRLNLDMGYDMVLRRYGPGLKDGSR